MDMHRMALNAEAARRAQNEALAEYWDGEVERENLRLERELHQAEWDALKGSPDHG
jgi:hypothetical protein